MSLSQAHEGLLSDVKLTPNICAFLCDSLRAFQEEDIKFRSVVRGPREATPATGTELDLGALTETIDKFPLCVNIHLQFEAATIILLHPQSSFLLQVG